jgi:dTDP-4-amino-4,6-dideoxygalactose transaminase
MSKAISVTKSFLPPIEEYMAQIKRAYDNEWLTNRGELVLELEQKLTDYLELHEAKIICMNNGTIPLQIALKLLGRGGEIITTPFSYVATTAAIVWENCTPIFVDIHPDYLTIDESKIEEAITERTTCILATHVFGNTCNIEEIQRIADKHNLKVIYDAAHCFGVKYKGKSIFEYGDISTCSFHATKLFHSGEGGAVFCKNRELKDKVFYSHNFGHKGPLDFYGLGINGKMSELSGAMGLSLLPHLLMIIQAREEIVNQYDKFLNLCNIRKLKIRDNTIWNFSYYPIIFKNENSLLKAQKVLNESEIYPRRYFYPSLSNLPYVNEFKTPISDDISSRILCLPLYYGLKDKEIGMISRLIINSIIS